MPQYTPHRWSTTLWQRERPEPIEKFMLLIEHDPTNEPIFFQGTRAQALDEIERFPGRVLYKLVAP